MASELKFALAQINPTVGDLDGNLATILAHCRAARDELGADAIVLPELAICGYPPEDLLLRDDFLARCAQCMDALRESARGIAVIIGHPQQQRGRVYNALSVLCDGETRALYRKRLLPNYTVFDEKRYFHAGREAQVVELRGVRIGLLVCEDLWRPGPAKATAALGAELMVAINASPFHSAQGALREEGVVRKRARECGVPMIYLNQVGGQDELVFDGASVAVDARGEVVARLPAFEPAMAAVVFRGGAFVPAAIAPRPQGAELIYRAIVLGVRDYIEKNRFGGVVLGLSGGIDSALCLAIAADAVGARRVTAIMMPSRHTSAMSLEDARAQARAMGVRYEVIPIEPMHRAALAQLQPMFADHAAGVTEENLQARCRGMLLMAISNQFGYMVLTTGNKSEMAVGYATLYGDMVGGFAAIKDVPKMMVYELARWRNGRGGDSAIIPERVLTRAPSAELAPNQTDADSLPPYQVLDPILEAFIERDRSPAQIIAAGHDADTVHRVVKMVVANEYKRRQSAPGVRVTARAFGKDRRYPITSGFPPRADG